MINFKSKGDNLTVAAPYNVASGEPFLVGAALFGIAVKAALSGALVAMVREGEFTNVPKAAGAAWVVGDILYWDPVAKNFTKTAAANTRVGVATIAAATGDLVGTVYLSGVVQ